MPPLAEVQKHRHVHLPNRSWCMFCVAGRGRAARQKRRHECGWTISSWRVVDNILVVLTGATGAAAVPEKCPADVPVWMIVKCLEARGFRRDV